MIFLRSRKTAAPLLRLILKAGFVPLAMNYACAAAGRSQQSGQARETGLVLAGPAAAPQGEQGGGDETGESSQRRVERDRGCFRTH